MVNENDLSLVLGIVLAVLALPSLLGAWVEERVPRVGAVMVLTGTVLIAIAANRHPGGYALDDVPAAFTRVLAGLTR